MSDQRSSDCDQAKRDIPSFIEPRPPLILNPFMRPRPQKGTNLLELFDEDSESEEPELVQVYLRLKPCHVRSNLYEVKSDRCLITSVDTAPAGHGRRTQHHVSKMYTFSHIFGPESNQKEIFEQVVKENLKKLPDGLNFTLLTYGASGSGKTYTLMGTVQNPGLVPRSLEYVFRVVDAAQQPQYKPIDGDAINLDHYEQDLELQFVRRLRQVSAPLRDKYRRMSAQLRNDLATSTMDLSNKTRYFVWVSFVEIYNEAIYDLLTNCDRSKATSKLRLREDTSGNVYVKGATQAFVRSGEEAYDILVAGKHNLQVAATGVHANSSRSHCIFTITMLTETDEGVRASCVRLCDLAGCERQRHARNTGARMQESRAINSSLHVLERCLHMLRRKQRKVDATLVPYRESKLTRLLGAGLCGARGEAVSMVVTLNPAPQYAHETRHVLQLAAVARDIHVNQTIQECTLESSTQDSSASLEPSVDLMRLREENDRLHFELLQAHARNKELMEAMEEKQLETARAMTEYVEEARTITRRYYETQLRDLRQEMEEMQEEYENKLKELSAREGASEGGGGGGTPSRGLQIKVAELTREIAILEEQLSAERLACARAQEELQHLRACIDERDEKAQDNSKENQEEAMDVTDESDSDTEDECNESLEPTFKKEDINRSRMLQQSFLQDHNTTCDVIDDNNDEVNSQDDDIINLSDKNETLKDSSDESDDESNTTEVEGSCDSTINTQESTIFQSDVIDTTEVKNMKSSAVRGTYVVADVEDENTSKEFEIYKSEVTNISTSSKNDVKFVANAEESFKSSVEKSLATKDITDDRIDDDLIDEVLTDPLRLCHASEVSLANFEQLEKAADTEHSKPNTEPLQVFTNLKSLKEKRNFFDEDKDTDLIPKYVPKKGYFDNIDNHKNVKEGKLLYDERSPSIVKEDVAQCEPSTMKKLLGESFTRQPDRLSAVTTISLPKKQASVDIFESPQVFFEPPNISAPKVVEKNLLRIEDDPVAKFDNMYKDVTPRSTEFELLLSQYYYSNTNEPKTDVVDKSTVNSHKEYNLQQTKTNTTTEQVESSIIKEKFDYNIGPIASKHNDTSDSNKNADIFIKHAGISKSFTANSQSKSNESIFEKCIEKKASLCPKEKDDIVRDTCKSIDRLCQTQSERKCVEDIKVKLERLSVQSQNTDVGTSRTSDESNVWLSVEQNPNSNNTTEYFDNMYKDITPRATEFELLLSQNNSNVNEPKAETNAENTHLKYNLRHKINTSTESEIYIQKELVENKDESIDKKVKAKKTNTDNKSNKIDNGVTKLTDKPDSTETREEVLENQAKCEGSVKPKRNLRLRRRKNETDETAERLKAKLKDIVNLQKEYSDVTMNQPAPVKTTVDIESPEKVGEENLPPALGIQSCPSKSVTRSRRKLFTPRAEPLDESCASGDSAHAHTHTERVRAPRPSYHRTRARRKL